MGTVPILQSFVQGTERNVMYKGACCGICRFSLDVDRRTEYGGEPVVLCRRYPPKNWNGEVHDHNSTQVFPGDWCGEFQPMDIVSDDLPVDDSGAELEETA